MGKKLFIMVTHGPENPEMATIPFVMANAGLASDVEVSMGFQGNGVMLIKRGCAQHVFAANFPHLLELMESYVELGGKMLLCGPCVKSRNLREEDFIENAKVVNAPTFVKEVMSADTVLVY